MKYEELEQEYDKDPQKVRDLLASGRLKASSFDKGTPLLSRAVMRERLDLAKDLIEAGADVNAYAKYPSNSRGMAPIHFAETPAAVNLLHKSGAEVDAPYQLRDRAWGMVGETALHSVVLGGSAHSLAVAEALIKAGADFKKPYSTKEYSYSKDSDVAHDRRIVRQGMTILDQLDKLRKEAAQGLEKVANPELDRGATKTLPDLMTVPSLNQVVLLKDGTVEKVNPAGKEYFNGKGDLIDPSVVVAWRNDGQQQWMQGVGTQAQVYEPDRNRGKDAEQAGAEGNVISRGFEQEQELSEREREEDARKRADLHRRQSMEQEQKEEASVQDEAARRAKDAQARAKEDAEKDKAVPDSVLRKFVQVEDKYYFPDETPAFVDGGEKLRASVEHKEVVAAIVAIAAARDWDKITVKGTEVFRRAVWMEASLRGIEVKGYKPSEIEQARLAKMLGKDRDASERAPVENTVEKGIVREAEKAVDQTPHNGDAPKEQVQGTPLRKFEGELLEHGEANYQFKEEESLSYFVRLKTDEGEKLVWGKDLKRAVAESEAQIGQKIGVEYMGNLPVKVLANVRDKEGKVVGKEEIETHRNTWNVERKEAFVNNDRTKAKNDPELVKAFGNEKMLNEAIDEKGKHLSPESKEKLKAVAKQRLAEKLEKGEPLPAVKLVRERKKVASIEQDRKAPEKSRDEEMTR